MSKLLFLFICLSSVIISCGQANDILDDKNDIINGDLMFCIAEGDNAITDVTQGIEGMKIEHVGIYYNSYIIEATPRNGVCLTPIDSFIKRNGGRVIVGRVDSADIKLSIENALSYKGLPYDNIFMPDDSAIYCSELVQKSFVRNDSSLIFSPIPMSFHDASGNITPFWIAFYKQRGMEVPEGQPGSNPGELSRRESVRIIRKW